MMRSEAKVRTAAASRYLQQLCKHFRHKAPVEFDQHRGEALFPFGLCRLTASDTELSILCSAESADALARVEGVLQSHLERFAWREAPEIRWTPLPGD